MRPIDAARLSNNANGPTGVFKTHAALALFDHEDRLAALERALEVLGREPDAGMSIQVWAVPGSEIFATYKDEAGNITKPPHDDLTAYRIFRQSDINAISSLIRRALDELGVPGDGYPAPVANAVEILRQAQFRVRA